MLDCAAAKTSILYTEVRLRVRMRLAR